MITAAAPVRSMRRGSLADQTRDELGPISLASSIARLRRSETIRETGNGRRGRIQPSHARRIDPEEVDAHCIRRPCRAGRPLR